MAEFYQMPAISPTMEMGSIVEWRVAEGATFSSGTVLAEVGTDKANMEAEIFDNGVLLKHLVEEGDEIPPGYPIAIWGVSADDDIAGLLAEFEAIKAKAAEAPAAEAEPEPEPEVAATAAPTPTPASTPTPATVEADVTRDWMGKATGPLFMDPPGDIRVAPPAPRVAASPLARKIAADRNVDLARLQGSGPGGRIVKSDVENAPTGGGRAFTKRSDEVKRNSPMRKTIAKRLLQSHTDIPTFFLTATFEMDAVVAFRTDLKAKRPELKFSYNDFLIAAVAQALVDHPEVNSSWGDKAITHHGRVDIGVAVAIEGGLITPVVRNADRKRPWEIAPEVRELATRAKAQKLQPEEYTGGIFTISNLGMMGIEHFTAIINPPEAAILAVGSIDEVPVVVDGEFSIGHRMKVTMTCDHRVIDGAVGAAFLQTVRDYVESPYLLLV